MISIHGTLRKITVSLLGLLAGSLWAGAQQHNQPPFPDTGLLMPRVAEHQHQIEKLFNQFTFTQTITVYILDKNGGVREQHADVYYVTPTPHDVFALHIG